MTVRELLIKLLTDENVNLDDEIDTVAGPVSGFTTEHPARGIQWVHLELGR